MDLLAKLLKSRSPLVPSLLHSGGVYAWFVRKPMVLGPLAADPEVPIYVGRSANLAAREYANHLNPDSSGWSTLRRSLGALLKDELQLTATPRGKGGTESNFRNYRFSEDGDRRLTRWMLDNLEVGLCLADDPVAAEAELLSRVAPVLDLRDCINPHAATVKCLRKLCADEARGGTLNRDAGRACPSGWPIPRRTGGITCETAGS